MSVGTGRRAFTLVELLVVIGIIALLISILLPSLSRARQAAVRIQCMSNMRQVGLAVQFYANDNRGFYPETRSPNTLDASEQSAGGPPWVGFNAAGWNYRLTKPGYLPFDWESYSRYQGVLWCPTDDITPVDPTFWYTYHIASLSSYRVFTQTTTDQSQAPYMDPAWGNTGLYPPCKTSTSPVNASQYGWPRRGLAPMMACAVGATTNGALLWGGTVSYWDGMLDYYSGNYKSTTRHGDGKRPILFNDGHVEFMLIYWRDEYVYYDK